MGVRLTDNFSSQYFEAANRLKGADNHVVRVFVEGYDDVPFWRAVLGRFENSNRRFEISIPTRSDLAKGKKVLLKMVEQSGKNLLLCMDGDFDYIFGDANEQSRTVNHSHYVFHTFAYSVENFSCYPPSLHGLCVRSTKNDRKIFDFERFMHDYSRIVYPLFIWYAYSAYATMPHAFTLADFKGSVKINFLAIEDNGGRTLEWLTRQVAKRLNSVEKRNAKHKKECEKFELLLRERGVREDNIYMFMQGHTIKDNVVVNLLLSVCDRLREISIGIITTSDRRGIALRNELSNYNNSLRDIKSVLDDNTNFEDCDLFQKLILRLSDVLDNKTKDSN